MKILNLHGFLGKADNRSYAALCRLMPKENIISPKIDYLHEHPVKLLDSLLKSAIENDVDLIVGQSLGGAYALLTAMRYGVPCILTNPCLHPADTNVISQHPDLPADILMEYRKIGFERYFGKAYILLSDHDELLPDNANVCRKASPHIRLVSGTHSRIDNLQEELRKLLIHLFPQESNTYEKAD